MSDPTTSSSIYIVIPAYQPNEALLTLCQQLSAHGLAAQTVVIDDGSGPDYQPIFASIAQLNCRVFSEAINQGKGYALKKALQFIQQETHAQGVITADADGQHQIADILRLYQQALEDPEILWLGVRDFRHSHIPLRSDFGNRLTRMVFYLFTKNKILDTQTGLRYIPRILIPTLLTIPSNRYEFELEMLLRAIQKETPIKQLKIKTIYMPGNPSSHFNPLLDSVKIYFVFIRYALTSVFCALVDLGLFLLLYPWLGLTAAVSGGRLVSSTLNFFAKKSVVFKSKDHFWLQTFKYTLLCVANAVVLTLLLGQLLLLIDNVFWSKIIAEGLLFFINFYIQRVYVFKPCAD